ncbi:hypothetical protein DKX38_028773 [Salix brachista]|uniref:S-protein homolog n=1 Tax=Salix brachista TaxID=2182728 RepID=A0A5N5JHZ9_9ROSI|nr:hypothetical protein DKX38_028773 [Salix brachista]
MGSTPVCQFAILAPTEVKPSHLSTLVAKSECDSHDDIESGPSIGLDLAIHCKSRNDDLGQHAVPFGGEYTIDFCPNFWGTTLFFCGMSWSGKVHWFDIYDASRDSSRCGNCSWTVEATGPCMDYYNYYTKEFVCYPWNDKASLQ